MTPQERYKKLKQHLKEENPILLDVISVYERLDKTAHTLGFLTPEESYTENISWWPLISILGTFSAGKSTFINEYLGEKVQQSGNQAVDDKFTVICYGNNEKVTTLPGLALDADPRFPFYNISHEVEKVEEGEGSRVNLYLQLKTVKAEAVKGKILIDSPGFDADSQRNSILRITSHIINMSDLVLIFFDARHPEPGAMRDTLEHLVGQTVDHRDRDKILYILNQIDTTAKEDNLEDVIGSWQRALSQKGLVSGNFYSLYSEDAMNPIEDPAIKERLRSKRDNDMATIMERMEGVKVERAYRISKALEDFAKEIKNNQFPKLHTALSRWKKRVFWIDTIVFVSLFFGLGTLVVSGIAPLDSSFFAGMAVVALLLFAFAHFNIKSVMSRREVKKLQESDPAVAHALAKNTKWYSFMLSASSKGWRNRTLDKLESVIKHSQDSIRKLNDQFVSPSGESMTEEKE